MSTVKSKNLQIGTDGTASNNFTIYQPGTPDGTLRVGNGNAGSATDVVTVNSSGNVNFDSGTLYVDATNNKVGVGTASPNTLLHIQGSNSGGNIVAATLRNNNAVDSTQTSLRFTNSSVDGTSGGGELSYLRNAGNQGSSFIVKTQSSVGVNTERMRIDTSGYVTMPNQPVFSARLGTSISSPTANQDVVFDTIQTNVGSHYSTSTGLFTAPVAGRYRFHSILQFHNGSAQIYAGAGFQVNGTTITSGYTNQYTTNAHALWAGEFVTSLSQNDTVNVTYFGQAATAPSIQGGNRSWFVGYLIG